MKNNETDSTKRKTYQIKGRNVNKRAKACTYHHLLIALCFYFISFERDTDRQSERASEQVEEGQRDRGTEDLRQALC